MNTFIKKYFGTLLFFTLVGLVGGIFTGLYLLDSYPDETRAQLIEQLGALGNINIDVDILIGIITAFQSAGYGLILGAIGIVIAKRLGLWKDEISIAKTPLLITVAVSILGGLVMILPDMLFFSGYSEAIAESYAAKPSIVYILATVTYAAVIEEVMLRLFTMSLIAFLLHKLFDRGACTPSVAVLITANVISALLFAAGHLPATLAIIGGDPLIILRCFLLNGGLGLLFGYLYRKHGLRYAMIAHGGCHIISKLIWVLFI